LANKIEDELAVMPNGKQKDARLTFSVADPVVLRFLELS
jgi:hypothetical protein